MNSASHLLKYSHPGDLKKQISQLNPEACQASTTSFTSEVEAAILHSTTGSFKELEAGVLQMTIMALKEINNNGGLLGSKINYHISDGASDERLFKEKAREASERPEIQTVFGSSTSYSRKQLKDIIEE